MADNNVDMHLKYLIESCFKVLKEFSWLLDSYILDFFTENHLEKLPKSWILHLLRVPPEELEYLLDSSAHERRHVWPLALLSLRTLSNHLSVPRHPKFSRNFNNHNNSECALNQKLLKEEDNAAIQNQIEENLIKVYRSACLKHSKLKNLFFKHVKPKKRHEILKMAELTSSIAYELGVCYVVDVGSGLGHLSRLMAYGFNLNVCCLERELALSKEAERLDVELEVTSNKHLTNKEMEQLKQKRPVQAHINISQSMEIYDFVEILKKAFGTDDNNFQFGIIGLHPCGNLTAKLLKLFIECPEAKFINLVGCCYHKLSTPSATSEEIGFPLSRFSMRKYVTISYEARALACHAIEKYCQRLRSKDYDHLQVHCFRATLERIIEKNWPQFKKCGLNNVKHKPNLKFNEYCESALKKLNVKVPKEDLESKETLANLSGWRNVVSFYSLRLILAPITETVILLDRMLYLKENGINCRLVPAFDPSISPRNHVLTAKKLL